VFWKKTAFTGMTKYGDDNIVETCLLEIMTICKDKAIKKYAERLLQKLIS